MKWYNYSTLVKDTTTPEIFTFKILDLRCTPYLTPTFPSLACVQSPNNGIWYWSTLYPGPDLIHMSFPQNLPKVQNRLVDQVQLFPSLSPPHVPKPSTLFLKMKICVTQTSLILCESTQTYLFGLESLHLIVTTKSTFSATLTNSFHTNMALILSISVFRTVLS